MKKPLISAQVVLRGTSRTDYENVKSSFEEAGFTVGPFVANNFSITAPVNKFESYFGTRLKSSAQGGTAVAASGGAASLELPAEKLPAGVRETVEAILFTSPPDFGPFNP